MFNATLVLAEIGDECSYLDHWCYDSPLAAAAALAVWDGQGEPVGWFRHAATGRRVSRSADERDADLRPVGAVGVTYSCPDCPWLQLESDAVTGPHTTLGCPV